jgi:uncharacterized protein
MEKNEMIRKTADYVRGRFEDDASGHDWWHVWRVWNLAKRIGAEEPDADIFIVEMAALLHDIADWKFSGDSEGGPKEARDWMQSVDMHKDDIEHVCHIIEHVSFRGSGVKGGLATIEGKIVQDADRLDAIGAIGIGRAFAYGGNKQRKMHVPGVEPKMHQTFEEYKAAGGTTINHFHEKLFLLKERMNTATGKRMAERRHAFMEHYVDRFMAEWQMKD